MKIEIRFEAKTSDEVTDEMIIEWLNKTKSRPQLIASNQEDTAYYTADVISVEWRKI